MPQELFSHFILLPPLMNVLFNPSIPDSLSLGPVLPWVNPSLFQLRNLVHPSSCRFHTFYTFCEKFDIPPHLFHFYLQIRHFFHSQSPSLTLNKPTPFEYLCAQGPHQPNLVCSIHHILHESFPLTEVTHLYMRRRAQLLGRPIISQLWDLVFYF